MLKVYTVTELAQKEQLSEQAILYRIRKAHHYIALKLEGRQYTQSEKGYTIRYLIKSELKDYLF